jgi:hypothetical protein
MKTRLIALSLTAMGLCLAGAAETAPVQASSTPSPVTVTTNAPAAPMQPASGFVLQPVGIVKEVEKLAQAGTDPGVIGAFIQSWQTPYSVSADDILRLHALGVPSDVLTTLIQHGAELGAQVAAANPNPVVTAPSPATPYQPPSGAPVVADQYPPPVTYPDTAVYPYPDYPAYDYSYPGLYSYGYSWPYYSYSPGISIGIGFGFRSHPGFHGGFGEHPGFGAHGTGFAGRGGAFGGRRGGGMVGHGGSFGGRSSGRSGGSFGGRSGGSFGRRGGR